MHTLLTFSGWTEDAARCGLNFFRLCARSREAQSG